MGKPESQIENYLRARVKETGGQCRKLRFISRRGAADNLVWKTFPRVAIVECKAPGESTDPKSSQSRQLALFRAGGWPVYTVSSRTQVDAVIAAILED